MNHKTFDEFIVGEVFESYGRTILDADIHAFTCFAGLKTPLFIDDEFARKKSPYGGRIAPGLMTASIASGMMEVILGPYALAALSFDEFKFSGPVKPGDTIHCEVEILDKRDTSDGERGILNSLTRVINQKDEPVLEFKAVFLMRKSA